MRHILRAGAVVLGCALTLIGVAPAHAGPTSAFDLAGALAAAKPGDTITVPAGTYKGQFVVDVPGVQLVGEGATIDGGSTAKGYALRVLGADGVHVTGLTTTGGQKGVVVDQSADVVLDGITVKATGMEGVHFRSNSPDGVLRNSTVSGTGLHTPDYGEAAYVGSAQSNWGKWSGGKPDASSRVLIENNTFEKFTAEGVDVKEGTTGVIIRGNTFDGGAISGAHFADSFIDLKGRDALVEGNQFTNPSKHVVDEVQQHKIVASLFGNNVVR